MDTRRSFSALWLLLAKLLFACAFFTLSGAAISFANDVPPRTTEIHFGATTIAVDSYLVLSVGGKSLPGTRREFDISNDTVQVALPPQVLASFSPPCEAVPSILMIRGALARRADNSLYGGLQPRKTDFQGISQLEPASGHALLELYQFDSDQLRDFWGDQIDFYKSGPLIRLKLQVTRDLRIELGTSAKQCFFERGETFVTQLRAFIFSAIISHP